MQDEVGRRETVEEGRRRGNYDAEDLEEDVRIFFSIFISVANFSSKFEIDLR